MRPQPLVPRLSFILLAVALTGIAAPAAHAQTPGEIRLVRLAVVDVSGSMAGERLATAVQELLLLGEQLPPAPDAPFLVVPFRQFAETPQVFVDLARFRAYVSALAAGGGTSIAAGLETGLDALQPYASARHVILVLVSDGEDGEPLRVRDQERRLDQLFATRGEQGLRNTVFAKRWERANAGFVGRMQRNGHVHVVDAADGRLVPVTAVPSLAFESSAWTDDESALDVVLESSVRVRGDVPMDALGNLRFTILAPDLGTLAEVDVPPGGASRVVVRVPAGSVPEGAPFLLQAHIDPPSDFVLADGVVVPTLATDRLELTFVAPARRLRCTWSVRTVRCERSLWSDPLRRELRFDVSLEIEALSPSETWGVPLELRLEPEDGAWIPEGGEIVRLDAPGVHLLSVSLGAVASETTALASDADHALAFAIAPDPAGAIVAEPAVHRVRIDAPMPPRVVTTVRTQVLSVGAARWTDLAAGEAAFEADLAVDVDGPLAAGTVLVVHGSPDVRQLAVDPDKVQSGRNLARLSIVAALEPDQDATMRLPLVPPAPQGGVEIVVDGPIEFVARGPSPLQAALADASGVAAEIVLDVADDAEHAVLDLVAQVLGVDDPSLAAALPIRVTLTGALGSLRHVQGAGEPLRLELPVPPASARSFWRDSVLEGEITTEPDRPTAAVLGSSQTIRIRVPAPFRRLLVYLCVVLGVVAAGFLAYRLWSAFTIPREERALART